MCESNVYLIDDEGNRSLFMESVDKITPNGDEIQLEDIMNKKKTIRARFVELSLVDHKITLQRVG